MKKETPLGFEQPAAFGGPGPWGAIQVTAAGPIVHRVEQPNYPGSTGA
jgi:hypothetical protein